MKPGAPGVNPRGKKFEKPQSPLGGFKFGSPLGYALLIGLAFLLGFTTIAINAGVAEIAVQLRKTHRLRLPDAIIWATAKTDGRLLVTRNVKDFPASVPGVREPYRI